MEELNLPKTNLKMVIKDNRTMVFDVLRRKYVALTPEEWVRQHFVHYLMSEKGYPAACIGNEVTITLNGLRKRCDSVVYGHEAEALMNIEYKAPGVAITQQVFEQISRYNMTLHVEWLVVSNGLQHYCCRIDYATGQCTFVEEVPAYGSLTPTPL